MDEIVIGVAPLGVSGSAVTGLDTGRRHYRHGSGAVDGHHAGGPHCPHTTDSALTARSHDTMPESRSGLTRTAKSRTVQVADTPAAEHSAITGIRAVCRAWSHQPSFYTISIPLASMNCGCRSDILNGNRPEPVNGRGSGTDEYLRTAPVYRCRPAGCHEFTPSPPTARRGRRPNRSRPMHGDVQQRGHDSFGNAFFGRSTTTSSPRWRFNY